jgi:hypothetical protein
LFDNHHIAKYMARLKLFLDDGSVESKHMNNGMLSPLDYEARQSKLKKAGV